jgi:hypothetical protein
MTSVRLEHTYRCVTSYLQYPLAGFGCERLSACHHTLHTVNHASSAGKLDEWRVIMEMYSFRRQLRHPSNEDKLINDANNKILRIVEDLEGVIASHHYTC